MNWIEENVRDEKLLARLDLELLSQGVVGRGEALAQLVGRHNDRLVGLTGRFNRLVGDRKRLVDFTAWADANLDVVLAERARVIHEAWDWLQALRGELATREAILEQAVDTLQALLAGLNQRREQTIVGLNRSMAKTRREYVEANPARGEHHFAVLVGSDDAVVAIDQEYAKRAADLEWVVDHRRRAVSGQSTVLVRQEEIFKHLVN